MEARDHRPPPQQPEERIGHGSRRQKRFPGAPMTLRERLSGGVVSLARPLLPALSLVSGELARAAAERRGAAARLTEWAATRADSGHPTVWLHGASAGELSGAARTVAELRARRDFQLVVSYFSPSAEDALPLLEPAAAEPLPVDAYGPCRRALEAVAPDVVVFAKGDLWPNFTRAASDLGAGLVLINGTVAPDSSRLRGPARWLLTPAYRRLDRAGAASRADARRLEELGVRPEALEVSGDAAFDQALERTRKARREDDSPAARLRRAAGGGAPVLVAGSTWREDEEALLGGAAELARRGSGLRLVLAPHEPDREAAAWIERKAREQLGRGPARWTDLGEESPPAEEEVPPRPILVDVVGVLAELYAAADLAWVGGGLGGTGLHSVVEPASAGVPVLFGPDSSRREAEELVRRGGGLAVAADRVTETLAGLVERPGRRRRMGEAARSYVEEEAGAGVASARLVEEALEGSVGSRPDAPAPGSDGEGRR